MVNIHSFIVERIKQQEGVTSGQGFSGKDRIKMEFMGERVRHRFKKEDQ